MRSELRALLGASLLLGGASGCLSFDQRVLDELDPRNQPDDGVAFTATSSAVTVALPEEAGSIDIPRNAVSGSVRLEIATNDTGPAGAEFPGDLMTQLASDVLVAKPHGTKFDKDVTLTLPLLDEANRDGDLRVFRLDDDDDDTWSEVDADISGGEAVIKTNTFSFYAVFEVIGDVIEEDGGAQDAGPVEGGTDGGTDAEVDAGGGNGELVPELCDPNTTIFPSANRPFIVSSAGMSNSHEVACANSTSAGGEGWFAVQAVAGQTWHFHVEPQNPVDGMTQNPFLYATDTCDFRDTCAPATTYNVCGDRQDEHFTFEATSTGTWYVALDDANPGVTGEFSVLAITTVCGDGISEHNEACDDGNMVSGDGCSSKCRREMGAEDLSEMETNDDWTTANILETLGAIGDSQSIRGSAGGVCDVDLFAVDVPAGGSIRASVRQNGGAACVDLPDTTAGLTLSLLGPNGRDVLGEGTVPAGVSCPAIDPSTATFAANLQAGLYFLQIFGEEDKMPFNYQLNVSLE